MVIATCYKLDLKEAVLFSVNLDLSRPTRPAPCTISIGSLDGLSNAPGRIPAWCGRLSMALLLSLNFYPAIVPLFFHGRFPSTNLPRVCKSLVCMLHVSLTLPPGLSLIISMSRSASLHCQFRSVMLARSFLQIDSRKVTETEKVPECDCYRWCC